MIKIKKTIYIDFDNVIVNSIKAICDLYNEDFQYYKDYHKVNWWDINSWEFKECNCATKDYINTYFNQQRFFDRLEFMPFAKENIYLLNQIYNINIITMGFKPNLMAKQKWLQENFPDLRMKMIGINMKKYKDKSHIDMSKTIFVDDCSKNLFTCNAKNKILFGDIYSWNEDWIGQRILNWTDLTNYLIMKGSEN